jgi:hypothetical protein
MIMPSSLSAGGSSGGQLLRCYDCGRAYCPECAEKDPAIKELGVCPDCEEVFEDNEDEGERWSEEGGR